MRKAWVLLLAVAVLVPNASHGQNICTDDRGKVTIVDGPCPPKKASTTNVPIKANELSDRNVSETIARFYKALSERDPAAATRFLADRFTSTVRRPHKETATDSKTSFVEQLYLVLPAVKSYTAKANCTVAKRTAAAYSLSCQADEQGVLGAQSLRTVSDETVTVVLEKGEVKIAAIDATERDPDAPRSNSK